jgi:hypothetical protein
MVATPFLPFHCPPHPAAAGIAVRAVQGVA